MFYGKEKKGHNCFAFVCTDTIHTVYLLINDLIACMHVRLSVLNVLIQMEFQCIDFFGGNEIFKKVNIIKLSYL